MVNYLQDYQGKSNASSIIVTPEGVRLPHQPCKFALISNFNIENNSNFTIKSTSGLIEEDEEEIYYGFNGVYVAQLFPSRNTELIPVNNLDQICLRSRPSKTLTVWYAWFW